MTQPVSAMGSPAFRFGVFQFHIGSLELTRQDIAIPLQSQSARLLRLLLLSAGEVVTDLSGLIHLLGMVKRTDDLSSLPISPN